MDWINSDKELPKDKFNKYLVKKENGDPITALFMPDKIAWIAYFGQKTSYWMDIDSGKLIHDVKYWMEAPKKIRQDSSEECLSSSCST